MTTKVNTWLRWRIALGGVALTFSALAASAQEYCVACTGPDAVYRCVIADPRPGTAPSLQVACTSALAKEGRHAACNVKRGVTVFDCDAPVKRISLGAASPEAAAGTAPIDAKVAPPPPVPAVDPKAPPKTLLEAAQRAQDATGRTVEKSTETMRKAGDATASFFGQSLRCLGSLFTDCGPAKQ
jgi:hypothetical protein